MARRRHLLLRVWKLHSEHTEANACGIRKLSLDMTSISAETIASDDRHPKG